MGFNENYTGCEVNGITISRTVHVKLLDSLLVLVSMENVDFAIFCTEDDTQYEIQHRRATARLYNYTVTNTTPALKSKGSDTNGHSDTNDRYSCSPRDQTTRVRVRFFGNVN